MPDDTEERPRTNYDRIISRAIDESTRLDHFVRASIAGLEIATQAVANVDLSRRLAEVLRKPDPFPSEAALTAAKQGAEGLERFAQEEGLHELLLSLRDRYHASLDGN